MWGGISISSVATPGPEISRNLFEPNHFFHKDKITKKKKGRIEKKKKTIFYLMCNWVLLVANFNQHVGSKFRSIMFYFGFRVRPQAVLGTYYVLSIYQHALGLYIFLTYCIVQGR